MVFCKCLPLPYVVAFKGCAECFFKGLHQALISGKIHIELEENMMIGSETRQRKNLKGRPRVPNQDGSSTD